MIIERRPGRDLDWLFFIKSCIMPLAEVSRTEDIVSTDARVTHVTG